MPAAAGNFDASLPLPLPFELATSVVERGGIFKIRDLRFNVEHEYRVKLGAHCFVITTFLHGREHYIGAANYGDVGRFKHAGSVSEFRLTDSVVRTFDRAWRRYLHPTGLMPDIRGEIAIHPLGQEK